MWAPLCTRTAQNGKFASVELMILQRWLSVRRLPSIRPETRGSSIRHSSKRGIRGCEWQLYDCNACIALWGPRSFHRHRIAQTFSSASNRIAVKQPRRQKKRGFKTRHTKTRFGTKYFQAQADPAVSQMKPTVRGFVFSCKANKLFHQNS